MKKSNRAKKPGPWYVTAAEMAEIDRRATAEYGISALTLMESAGRAVTDVITTDHPDPDRTVVFVVFGKGKNGGDGLVVARLLYQRGYPVVLLPAADPATIAPGSECALQLEQVRNMLSPRVDVPPWDPGKSLEEHVREWERREEEFHPCEKVVVDAIYGTGLKADVTGRPFELIQQMNRLSAQKRIRVYAVDVPSGLDANTGRPRGIAVVAHKTVTMGLPKKGFKAAGSRKYLGKLTVADIGFPPDLIEKVRRESVQARKRR